MNTRRYATAFCATFTLLLFATALPAQEARAQLASASGEVAAAPSGAQPEAPQPNALPPNELESKPEAWTKNLGKQVRRLLDAPDAERQNQAMMAVVHFAGSVPDPAKNFRPAVPRLLEIYESDASAGRRLLALSALSAIGTPFSMKRLAEHASKEKEGRVYRHTLSVLALHRN